MAIRLLLTGCRKNEVLNLRWPITDPEAREMRLLRRKEGTQDSASVTYCRPHVIPDALNDKAITALQRCSAKIRKCAGLEDMHLRTADARSLRRCWRTARAWQWSGSCLGTARSRRAHAMRISREIPCMRRLAGCADRLKPSLHRGCLTVDVL